MILSGDSGGTKTELALFKQENGKIAKIISEKFLNKEYSSLEEIIEVFLKDNPKKIDSACIAIAGPVFDGRVISTNLRWNLDERILSGKLNIKNFKLVNDLEAIAAAVTSLDENDVITIYKGDGTKSKSNKVILAPGTGLGVAALIYLNGKFKVVPTEGGHSDFAPSDDIEIQLLVYLKKIFGHVSCERIASGTGIVNIFNFLKEIKYSDVSNELLERMKHEDAAAVISGEALMRKSVICEKALDIFTSALGAHSGNMVLNYKATGGVYLGGGIPMKISDKLRDGTFVNSFLNKGRLSYLTEMTPVYIIKDSSIGLLGAAILSKR